MKAVLIALGAYHVALALLMAIAPGTFFDEIGPFGIRNDHYIRDTATFYGALGIVTMVAAHRPPWRVPVLAFTLLQYVLHSINHLADISEAEPESIGVADFVLLAGGSVLLALLLRQALRERE